MFCVAGETGDRGLTGDHGDAGHKGDKGAAGECAVAPKSAFSAKLSEARTMPVAVASTSDAVRFDAISLNEQGDYNAETGRFTCRYRAVTMTTFKALLFCPGFEPCFLCKR